MDKFNFQKYNDKNIDYLDSYNVTFSPSNSYNVNNPYSSVTYAFDWSVLPDQPYNVHFSYLGGVNNLAGDKIANIYIDFGAGINTFSAGSSTTAIVNNYFGVLKPYVLGTNSFLLAEDGTNPPIYLSGRPTNNIFTVQVLDNDGQLFTGTLSQSMAPYRIILKFIPVKNFLSN